MAYEQEQPNKNFLFDGDIGFLGFNSRDNPNSLEKGTLALCQNYRLNRGIAETRKGLKRLTPGGTNGIPIRHITTYKTESGTDYVVMITQTGLFYYDAITGSKTGPIAYPTTGGVQETILSTDDVGAFQALGNLYIMRGFDKRPLMWNGVSTITVIPETGIGFFPKSSQGMYIGNRGIVQVASDQIAVSHYLDLTHFEQMDVFKINDGSNDQIVAIAPWVLNEYVVFMRNRMYYASTGAGAYTSGDAPLATDSYVKILATDIGCVARGTVAQAAGGMIFLSDGGVYMLTPSQATTPEGMRMGVLGAPLSATIDDIIQRINQTYVSKSVGIYFNNRYYLAIPIDGSATNNVVIIYNFVNKRWESIDTHKSGMDVSFMVTGIYQGKRRLFYGDKDYGLYITEELNDGDQYDDTTNNNTLPVYLPFPLYDPQDATAFTRFPIDSQIVTRAYNFGFSEDKRYSQVEIDVHCEAGTQIISSLIALNPDSTTTIDTFGVPVTRNSTRDLPIRKVASSSQIKVQSFNGQSSVRSLFVTAVRTGNNIRST
jgi:hypothetical protein